MGRRRLNRWLLHLRTITYRVFIMLQLLDNKPSIGIRAAVVFAAALLVAACSSQERAKSYYASGMKLLEAHDNARAAIEFKNALRLDKRLLAAWRSLAQVDELIGQRGELIPIFRSIVELDPTDNSARLKLARLLLASGTLDEALSLANTAKEADGQNADVLALRALVLFKLNDMAGSVEEAQAALKIDPGNAGATIVLAAERLARDDSKGALQLLDSEAVSRTQNLGIDLFKLKVLAQIQDL